MNNEIKYSCDNCLFYSNTGCKSSILCIRGSNYFPSDASNISYQEVKIKKIEKSDEIKRLRTARNTLEQITAIRTAEYALDKLCKSKDVQPVKQWVKLHDKHPDTEGFYLVCDQYGECEVAEYIPDIKSWFVHKINGEIRYWMPLPEPPKDGDIE